MKSIPLSLCCCLGVWACTPTSSSGLSLGDVAGDATLPVSVTVTGLLGQGLVLQLNGGSPLDIAADGSFVFAAEIDDGADYEVKVARAPVLPSQTCVVAGGTGKIAGVGAAASVSCTIDRFAIGGLVSGLATPGLVLALSGQLLPVSASGGFSFPTLLDDLSDYSVTVSTQPTGQLCEAKAAQGKLNGRAIDTVRVECKTLVLPAFPAAAAWNDYVQVGGAPCDASLAQSYSTCAHGGAQRAFLVYGRASCTGLSASDALAAFEWECEAGDPVRFVSRRLAPAKRLRDLIDPAAHAFRANTVSVYDGASLLAVSPATVWWSNPIKDATATALNEAGTIYLLVNDGAYSVTADHVGAIVTSNTGLAPTSDMTALVTIASRSYVWLEGKLVAKRASEDASHGVLVQSSRFVVLRGVSVDNAATSGIFLQNGGANALSDIVVTNSAIGIAFTSAVGLVGERLTVVSSTGDGLRLTDVADSQLDDLQVINGTGSGLVVKNTTRSTFAAVRANNNEQHGVELVSSKHNRFTRVTSTSNAGASVRLDDSNGNWLLGLTAALSATGLDSAASSGNRIAQAVFVGNAAAVSCDSGSLAIADHATDLVGYAATSGCALSLDSPTSVTASTLQASFVGLVASDAVNPSDAAGIAERTKLQLSVGLVGWYSFSNAQRAWGNDAAFLSASQRGECGISCQIVDWSLAAGDTVLRAGFAAPAMSLTHEWTGATQNECDAIPGATFGSSCTSSFFPHAIELAHDDVGNDNGLCESAERCVLAPNVASHQDGSGFVAL